MRQVFKGSGTSGIGFRGHGGVSDTLRYRLLAAFIKGGLFFCLAFVVASAHLVSVVVPDYAVRKTKRILFVRRYLVVVVVDRDRGDGRHSENEG